MVVTVPFVVVIEDASDELLVVMDDCNPSMRMAADELLVETALLRLVTDEFNEAEVE